jgi:vacuolar protein 8
MQANGEDRIRAAHEIEMLTKSSAKCRASMASAGAIQPLVSMLLDPDLVAKEASMLALLNLAAGNER